MKKKKIKDDFLIFLLNRRNIWYDQKKIGLVDTMNGNSYFDSIMDGLAFIRAVGSIIGILCFIAGLLMVVSSGRAYQKTGLKIVLVSILLLAICGPSTGFNYFHIL